MEALHGEHDVTVLDLDPARLAAISQRFDVATLEANGASRRALADAGVRDADLVLACTSRDEANLVAGTFARLEAPKATTVIRASNVEYIELWRQGQLDVDFVVSSEIETAHAIARVIGVSAAVQTDVFADGQVQLVEYDVTEGASAEILGKPLRDAVVPADSRVAAIIRGERDDAAAGRRRDPRRRPDRRDRLAAGRDRLGRGARSLGGRGQGRRHLRGGTRRHGDRPRATRPGHRRQADRGEPRRARAVAEAFPKARVYNVSGPRPGLPRSASRSGTHRRRCSRCGRTPRTTTPQRSPASTASRSRSRSSTTPSRGRSTSTRGSTCRSTRAR